MKTIFDPKMIPAHKDYWGYTKKGAGGYAFVGRDAYQYLERAVNAQKTATGYKIVRDSQVNIKYPGREAKTWDECLALLTQAWPEATSIVQQFIDEVAKHPLPEPHDIRRKNKWNDDEGEIDIPRAMDGESELYRKAFRHRVKGPNQIVLLANLDCPGHGNKTGVFFRSIVTIVLADLLESKGYGVEIWAWCAGCRVFRQPNDYQLNALQVKRSDQPLDKDTLCNVLSAWFTYYGIWASWNCDAQPVSVGSMISGRDYGNEGYWDPNKQPEELRAMLKYVEPEEANAQVYMVPQIFASDYEMIEVKVPFTKKRRVKGPDGKWAKDEKGRFIREKYEGWKTVMKPGPAGLNPKAVNLIVAVCKDILTEIIRRENDA